jgi:hypothetical protein
MSSEGFAGPLCKVEVVEEEGGKVEGDEAGETVTEGILIITVQPVTTLLPHH